MIIHSIRVKNIKSYGEGPEGRGVTVTFEHGTNGIAGKNGHGKTTLVEALGYALFLAEPEVEEKLDEKTYLLRSGAKAGEIDVTFKYDAELFRLECGLGQTKRRTKVVQASDESICAEGEVEVAQYLCRLLGFPGRERLSETFSKLVGVKQGRLTWPFDSKPKEAKSYFEPLLDVAIFRDCFERLKPAVDIFDKQRQDWNQKLAVVEERIRERREVPNQLQTQNQAVQELEQRLAMLSKALESARKLKQGLEATEAAVQEGERQLTTATTAQMLAVERTKQGRAQAAESESAAQLVVSAKESHHKFEAAEAALKELRKGHTQQQKLERQFADLSQEKAKLEGAAEQAFSKAKLFADEKAAKDNERKALALESQTLRHEVEKSREAFDAGKRATQQAREDMATLRGFCESLNGQLARQETALGKINGLATEVNGWDSAAFDKAVRDESELDQNLQGGRQQLAQARQRHETLAAQLKEITGGLCPFLREKCQQFNPAKVGADLKASETAAIEMETKLTPLEAAHKAARGLRERLHTTKAGLDEKRARLQELSLDLAKELVALCPKGIPAAGNRLGAWAKGIPAFPVYTAALCEPPSPNHLGDAFRQNRVFAEMLRALWDASRLTAEKKLEETAREEQNRAKQEQTLENHGKQEKGLIAEITRLGSEEKSQLDAAAQVQTKVQNTTSSIGELLAELRKHDSLADEIKAQETMQERTRAGYLQFVQSKPLADQLATRQAALQTRLEEEKAALLARKQCEEKVQQLRKDFDPGALGKARVVFDEKNAETATQQANLRNAKTELDRLTKLFLELEAARKEEESFKGERKRVEAAIELTELARKVLRDSAPAVAQRLCNRIAARAQQVFNRINDEPVQLAWDATRFSLRIEPGGRHFAMLSGGEQTKLALAMTLAMIQEFSQLHFAVFDEPTYAVDSESRQKLAEAIIEAQKAAGLEQLIVVSHDDAFEGKLEHVIMLQKHAATGTEPMVIG